MDIVITIALLALAFVLFYLKRKQRKERYESMWKPLFERNDGKPRVDWLARIFGKDKG